MRNRARRPRPGPPAPRRGARSLRVRLTTVSTLVIVVVLGVGLWVIEVAGTHWLYNRSHDVMRAYGTSVTTLGAGHGWPDPLPDAPTGSLWAQVVGPGGDVVAASRQARGQPACFSVRDGRAVPVPGADPRLAAASGDAVVVPTVRGGVRYAVFVVDLRWGRSVWDEEAFIWLVGGLPFVGVLAAAVVWVLVGRALKPVESMRREVTEITAANLHRRITSPESDDELARLATTLNGMLDRLQRATDRQRRFVADASHELRSPLASVRTTLDVGLAYPDEAPWPTLAARATADCDRLQRLIDELLALARLDDRGGDERREPVDLCALGQGLVAEVRAARPDLRIRCEGPSTTVGGRPEQLARLLRNLLDNAARHATRSVVVTVRRDGDVAELAVADDGPGIPEEDRERVFDRFVRLDRGAAPPSGRRATPSRADDAEIVDRAADRPAGAGLGLAIARAIALGHGGTLAVAPAPPGRGATFLLRLPGAGGSAPPHRS